MFVYYYETKPWVCNNSVKNIAKITTCLLDHQKEPLLIFVYVCRRCKKPNILADSDNK